jgi:hypothetical protein
MRRFDLAKAAKFLGKVNISSVYLPNSNALNKLLSDVLIPLLQINASREKSKTGQSPGSDRKTEDPQLRIYLDFN